MAKINFITYTLKTLQDLKPKLMMYGNEEAICYELKAEAIKWILVGVKKRKNPYKMFMDFFNITEEDLKNGP